MKLNDKILHKAEDIIYLILSILVLFFILYEIVDLIYIFFSEVIQVSFLQYESISKIGVPIFFNIIIALEILETFKDHHNDIIRRVRIILLIALTAVARKIITMDIKHSEYHLLIGISILVLALCLGYFFLNKIDKTEKKLKQ